MQPYVVFGVDLFLTFLELLPPMSPSSFNPPDASQVTQWINGGYANTGIAVGALINAGQLVTNNSLASNGINPADAADYSPPPPGSPYYPAPEVPVAVGRAPTPAAPSYAPPAFSLPPAFSVPLEQTQPVATFSGTPPPESQTDQPLAVQTSVNSVQLSGSYAAETTPPSLSLGLPPSFDATVPLQTVRPVKTSLSGIAESSSTTQGFLPTVRPVGASSSVGLSSSSQLSFQPTVQPVDVSSTFQSQIQASSGSVFTSVSSGVIRSSASSSASLLFVDSGVAGFSAPTQATQQPKSLRLQRRFSKLQTQPLLKVLRKH